MSFPHSPPINFLRFEKLIYFGLFSFALTGCEIHHNGVIDVLHQPTGILFATVTPTEILTDSIHIGPFQTPEDILTISVQIMIKSGGSYPSLVGYGLFEDLRSTPIATGELNDLGHAPDNSPSDSVFSGMLTFQIGRSFIGDLFLELVPWDSFGSPGTSFVQRIGIKRVNHPPELSNLQAPDTIRTTASSSFLISVRVIDPDGAADVATVTRLTPSGNTFFLNDTGINGDLIAGDGIFTESVSPPTVVGSYTFLFRALDLSKATSNTIQHTIIVLP